MTAYEIPVLCVSFDAAADLSAKQYHLVKLDANGDIVACSATTDKPVGVLQDNPPSGSPGNVMLAGVTKLEVERAASNSAVNEGDLLSTDASGRAEAVTPNTAGTAVTRYIFGQALTAAAAANSRRLITAHVQFANITPSA